MLWMYLITEKFTASSFIATWRVNKATSKYDNNNTINEMWQVFLVLYKWMTYNGKKNAEGNYLWAGKQKYVKKKKNPL